MTPSNAEGTLLFIPGLLSDDIVWQATLDRMSGVSLPVHHADISELESITGSAQQLIDLVDGPLVVAGHSLGARIAMELVRLAPERVQGLILADTGTHPRREGEAESRQAMIDFANARGLSALADNWLPPAVHPSRHDPDPLMQTLREMVLRASLDQHERQMRALLDRPDAGAYLHQIRCPVLVLVGRHDEWSPLAQHEDMVERIHNAELAIIEDAGHFAPVEKPAEVAAVIRSWMLRHFA